MAFIYIVVTSDGDMTRDIPIGYYTTLEKAQAAARDFESRGGLYGASILKYPLDEETEESNYTVCDK